MHQITLPAGAIGLPNLVRMGEALAILAAVLFALGTVLQQKGTLSTEATEGDPHFLLQILRRPVWLAGAVLQSSGWVVQAMALDRASLVVVQSLTALSLVIALPLGARAHRAAHRPSRAVRRRPDPARNRLLHLGADSHRAAPPHPSATTWWAACLVTGALVVALFGVG